MQLFENKTKSYLVLIVLSLFFVHSVCPAASEQSHESVETINRPVNSPVLAFLVGFPTIEELEHIDNDRKQIEHENFCQRMHASNPIPPIVPQGDETTFCSAQYQSALARMKRDELVRTPTERSEKALSRPVFRTPISQTE